jgi:hypothetical protein
MSASDESEETLEVTTPTWAKQLAERRKARNAVTKPVAQAETQRMDVIQILWKMFDDAVEQAQDALNEYGIAERIEIERTSHDYQLSMLGPEGEPRKIIVFANVRMVDGQMSGGSHIATNQTRATIYLVPTEADDRLHWIVAATGKEFTPPVISDLFLSVFTDHPTATRRLSPYFSISP